MVRDLLFKNLQTFKEFAAVGEGIATNVLTDRLERLQAAGIVEQRADSKDGRRVIYRLTEKGFDLAPTLMEMVIWAARYEDTEAPPEVVSEMTNHRKRVLSRLRADWRRKR